LRFAQVRAMGRKASDEFTVPLCRAHHREAHRVSNEQDWWAKLGLAPLKVARRLWRRSHGGDRLAGWSRGRRGSAVPLNDHGHSGNGAAPVKA
jgi:hypothetical protein